MSSPGTQRERAHARRRERARARTPTHREREREESERARESKRERVREKERDGDCTRSGTASPGTEPVTWLVRLDATSMDTNGNCAGDQVEDARMYRLLDSAFALPGLPSWKENQE